MFKSIPARSPHAATGGGGAGGHGSVPRCHAAAGKPGEQGAAQFRTPLARGDVGEGNTNRGAAAKERSRPQPGSSQGSQARHPGRPHPSHSGDHIELDEPNHSRVHFFAESRETLSRPPPYRPRHRSVDRSITLRLSPCRSPLVAKIIVPRPRRVAQRLSLSAPRPLVGRDGRRASPPRPPTCHMRTGL